MYKIQANASGTRSIEVNDSHLETIRKYSLLSGLVDSNGIIDEDILDKLRFNVRGLLESNQNMKAIGLGNLVALYKQWAAEHQETDDTDEESLMAE